MKIDLNRLMQPLLVIITAIQFTLDVIFYASGDVKELYCFFTGICCNYFPQLPLLQTYRLVRYHTYLFSCLPRRFGMAFDLYVF